MADNTELNVASGGDTIATDDIAGVKHQRVKIQHGADGSATDVSSASPLPVDDAGGSLTVDNAGLTALDGAIAGTEVQVDVLTSALPTGAATSANQLADGHNVTVDNASGASAVNVQDGGNSLTVDNAGLTALDGAITGTELQVDVVAPLPAGTNAIGKLAANSGVDIGDVDVTSISAGANLVGDVGISGARTSGGTTLYKNIDVDESEDQVKGTAGQVYWIHAINLKATPLFLKFYNAAAASVTVGTTVPDLTFPVPSAGDTNGAGFTIAIPNGIAFGTAITVAATTGVADNDSGAPGANELILNLGFA